VFQHNGNDRIFLSASYGTGAAVIELTRRGDRFQTKTVWENQRMKNRFMSSILHNGFLYGLDESILACLDAGTGEEKWKGGRYGYGQIMLAGDHLIVLTEDGEVVLVRATSPIGTRSWRGSRRFAIRPESPRHRWRATARAASTCT
jgi:outer membrane protein assembly factor BamB